MLQSMGLQRVGQDLRTEQQQLMHQEATEEKGFFTSFFSESLPSDILSDNLVRRWRLTGGKQQ